MVTREITRTPRPLPDDYDWRKEPWVNGDHVRALSYHIANHIVTAMAAHGDDAQDEEDEKVYALLNPQLTERIWKGDHAREIVDPRILCAAAQGIDLLITQWMKVCKSIDSPGLPPRKAVQS